MVKFGQKVGLIWPNLVQIYKCLTRSYTAAKRLILYSWLLMDLVTYVLFYFDLHKKYERCCNFFRRKRAVIKTLFTTQLVIFLPITIRSFGIFKSKLVVIYKWLDDKLYFCACNFFKLITVAPVIIYWLSSKILYGLL